MLTFTKVVIATFFYIATGRFTFAIAKFTNFMATPPNRLNVKLNILCPLTDKILK